MPDLALVRVSSEGDLAEVRSLFKEYASSLDFDLCFQDFDRELAELPGRYAPPSGRLLVGTVGADLGGCVAMRKIGEDICEMKRLFVRPALHGRGLGRRLAVAITAEARALGYRSMRLDTVPTMKVAISLYESLGFRDVAPYTENPIQGARFMELELR